MTPTLPPADTGAIYLNVRVLLGIIIGLGLTHLLRHVARIIEHPGRHRVYWVHLVWVASVFLFLLHFWWWEFRLSSMTAWSFAAYLFVALYALLLYLLCVFVLPESLDDYTGWRDYYYARRRWFFGTFALIYVFDLADTWLKGGAYFESLGPEYPLRSVAHVVLFLVAIATPRPGFHATLAVLVLLYQVSWIVLLYEFI
ncbi:MAG: hypothetical protein ABW186_11985 [Rhodanobacteraceae bacterium]